METKIYAPVRLDKFTGKEFIDYLCARSSLQWVEADLAETRKKIKIWHDANPVMRISQFKLVEIE